MSEPFIGEIRLMPYSYAPREWARCEGQMMQIQENPSLFSIISTTYGGDGMRTFALPDLRSKVPMNQGHGIGLTQRMIGWRVGSPTTTLHTNEMPSHNHVLNVSRVTLPDHPEPGQDRLPHILRNDTEKENVYVKTPEVGNYIPMASATLSNTGSSLAHNNIQPSLGICYCIALDGIYPSRS